MPKLSPEEEAHARSIEEAPAVVEPIPPLRRFKVLVGSVVRKPPQVLAAFLRTLGWQRLRAPLDISYHFVADFAPGDAFANASMNVLTDFVQANKNVRVSTSSANPGGDYGDGPTTRLWQSSAMQRVGILKNGIFQRVLTEGFDACWLVDADVLCDSYTLQSLWDTQQPIVAGVYWTHWQKPDALNAAVVHAGPQVWLRHPYRLDGHGYTEASFRAALIARGLLRVWGLGACTLFHSGALAKGVSFAPVPEGLSAGPMSEGEDRHLCERVRRLHLSLHADAWPDIFHAYHPSDVGQLDARLEQLGAVHPTTAQVGDLVSAVVRNLEQPDVGPEWVRGRLGTLQIVPEIAEALATLSVGDTKLVRVHFPVHYPLAPYRGQTRLFHVALLDAKPYRLPPVIDEELLLGARSGATLDPIALSAAQVDNLVAEAGTR